MNIAQLIRTTLAAFGFRQKGDRPASGMIKWLKADVGALNLQGRPANPGDVVGKWLDQSGNGNHWINPSPVADGPILRAP